MWNKIITFFKPPVFSNDDDKTHAAALLNSTVLSIMAGTILFTVFARSAIPSRLFGIVVPILLLQAGSLILIRRGNIRVVSTGLVAGLWLILVYASYINGGVRAPAFSGIIVIVMAAGFLINIRSGLVVAGLSIAAGIWLIMLEDRGVLPVPVAHGLFTILLAQITYFIVVIVLLALATRSIRQALTRARLNEERYRLIASVMSDYAFSIQYAPDGTIADQWLSGAFETITGYTPEEFIAQGGWTSIVHPKDKELDASDMAKLRANQKVVTEIRLIRKDGEVRWVRSYGHPLWDEKRNQLSGIYGAVQDITIHKEFENNLLQGAEESALLYRISLALTSGQDLYHALRAFVKELKRVMTVDAFHVGLYDSQTDQFSYSLFLNLEDDLQLPPRTLRDKPGLTWEVISTKRTLYLPNVSDPQTQRTHNIVVVVDAGIRSYIGIPLMLQDKVIGIMSVQSCQIDAYTPGKIRLLETLAAQVTSTIERSRLLSDLQLELFERQKLIIELEAKNAEAETLRESVAIVASTLERSEAINRILEQLELVIPFNSASVQLVNGNMLEIVSARGFDLENDDATTKFKLNANEPAYPVIQGNIPYILYDDVQVSIPTFNEIPHNNIRAWMAVPLKVKGKIIGVIALDGNRPAQFSERDAKLAVTYANQVAIALENARLFSELQSELSVRQTLIDELEAKNAELERFTYTVSHDLRSPLVTIKGFLGFMEQSASRGNMEGFRKDMKRVSAATDRMEALLKDVLELSRVGRLINKPQEISFENLIHEALEIVHGRIQQRGITIHIQPNLPIVYGDRTRLMEVLQNLLDNAAKYMGDQKNPMIEIGTDGYDDLNHIIFFVRDNGMGIDPEYHDRIFGMFDKLNAESEGTGIGLALVKRIIEFHECKIWVESKVGKGSTFYFTLPGIKK